MKKISIIVLVLALAGGSAWYFLPKKTAAGDEGAVSAERLMAKAEKRDIEVSIEISGDVIPAFQLDVKPEVGGKVKVLHVEPGQTVKANEVLVEIDDTDILKE